MQQFYEQRIATMWKEKEDAALDEGDFVAYRSAAVNHRVVQTIAVAKREGWDSWKTHSVCKYIQRTFENMVVAELASIEDQGVHELITHASEGFDAHARRRAGRQ